MPKPKEPSFHVPRMRMATKKPVFTRMRDWAVRWAKYPFLKKRYADAASKTLGVDRRICVRAYREGHRYGLPWVFRRTLELAGKGFSKETVANRKLHEIREKMG